MIIDLTHTITPEMPMYPGSAAPSIKPTGSLTRDGFRETQLTIASHTGTHMDAPSHMLPRGSTLEVLPASQFCGRAVVLDVSDLPPRSVITADYLREQNGTIRSADFVLFYTGWERKWGTGAYYDDDFPVPDQEAAKYLVSCGLKGVGTDALSVDTLRDQQFLAHKTLLDGGLVILESLCLKKVVGRTDLMLFALPLKFENAAGARHRGIPGLPGGKGDGGALRKFLAILVCKLGRAVGKLVGKGSSMPGKFALKICPDILARVQLPSHIIAVTGSNGKTSTVEMIAAILRAGGKTVVYNEEGSNQIEGVTTLVLTHASLTGRVRADVLLIESDERYAAQSFRYFHPTEFVITNLYRDQLTRNGHPEWVYDAILPALHPETELILNADDPLSSCFARGRDRVKWFGLGRCPSDTASPTGVYHDGACCPVCHAPMEYDYVHYNHIGAFRCTKCGHHKPATDYTATALDLGRGTLTIDSSITIQLAFRSIYNVYNILAAYAACRECGVASDTAAGVINNYILKNGRMQKFTLGEHRGMLLTSKHENSIAYDTNLRYIRAAQEPCTVLVIVDAVSRKYFTSETSWLWDIDFDQLNAPQVQRIILSGRYCNDLAERFSFTDIPREKVTVQADIPAAAAELKADGSENVYVVTCFSDRDKILSQVVKEA